MKSSGRDETDRFIPRNFSYSSGTVGESQAKSAEVDLDEHQIGCPRCHAALDVPTPASFCVTRLCETGRAFLAAALSERGAMLVRLAVAS